MLIVHRQVDGDVEVDVEVEVNVDRATATVADLAELLGEASPTLVVDGAAVSRDLALVETPLVEGSVVGGCPDVVDDRAAARVGRPAPAGGSGAAGRACLALVTVGGLDAGRRIALGPGSWLVGRHPGADLRLASATVSGRHARLRVGTDGALEVRDLGSRNGTWRSGAAVGRHWSPVFPGDELRFGAVVARAEPAAPAAGDRPTTLDPRRHADAHGRLPLHRPPRPAPLPAPVALRPPRPPAEPPPHPGYGLAAAVLPAAAGLATVAATGNWLFALLPLLTPVAALGVWWQGRRRSGRVGRREQARFRDDLERLAGELAVAAVEEVQRRAAVLVDLGEVMRRGRLPSRRLWERRPGDDDFLRLTAGTGDVPWSPPVGPLPDGAPAALADTVRAAAVLAGAPVEVDLAAGGVVGIVGPPLAARSVARALVAQAVVHHGPADLDLAVVASPAASPGWTWCRWLPHVVTSGGGDRRIRAEYGASAALLDDLLRRARAGCKGGGDDRHGGAAATSRAGAALRDGRSPGGRSVGGRTLLVVVDDDRLLGGPRSAARAVLRGEAGPVAGVVVASSVDRLPASCTTVVELQAADGRAIRTRPSDGGDEPVELLAAGLGEGPALALARSLARFSDPERVDTAAALPARVGLMELLGAALAGPRGGPRARPRGGPRGRPCPDVADGRTGGGCTAAEDLAGFLAARWASGGSAPSLAVPLGRAADGPLVVDLVSDGPHALVAGTTGSGKSELLRTWVAGLAATVDPRHLNVVLIDYKGGSAFDECARLPHTVAVVTDLDPALAQRALRCLDAELRHRERQLREVGASDLVAYQRTAGRDRPLPRLVVVVDEFATLVAELPGFVDALVGVAQRGRSLGVHLVLATQRPAGVVSDAIRANTNLRVALRVQDRHDSHDVLGIADAAALPRDLPGRAVVRFGPGEAVGMQAAFVSEAARLADVPPLRPLPEVGWFGPPAPSGHGDRSPAERAPLRDLTVAAQAAAQQLHIPPPRCPWPPALPARITLHELVARLPAAHGREDVGVTTGDAIPDGCGPEGATAGPASPGDIVPLYLVDDPDHQARYPGGWCPAGGNLLVAGAVGSGATTTLVSVALSLTAVRPPAACHLYAIDAAAGALRPLAALPHCGGVVDLGDDELLDRLITRLRRELDHRRCAGAPPAVDAMRPEIVLLIDGWAALQAELDGPGNLRLGDDLARVIVDGPGVGLRTVVAVDRPAALRPSLAAAMTQRLVLRQADATENRAVGLVGPPAALPGRAVALPSGLEVQVAVPTSAGGDHAAAVAAVAVTWTSVGPDGGPTPLGRLPARVVVADLVEHAQLRGDPWFVPIGVGADHLAPTGWTRPSGEHVLVTGPARSGRTSTLRVVVELLRHHRPDLAVVVVAGRRDPSTWPDVDACISADRLDELDRWIGCRPLVVVADDADQLDDPRGRLAALADAHRPDVTLVAAARNDAVRNQYGSWVRRLRSSRLGLLLQPDVDADGDLFGLRVPRRCPVPLGPGRGYLVDGSRLELVQVAELARA